MRLTRVVAVALAGLMLAGPAMATDLPFFDGFDDGNWDGWTVQAPPWALGTAVEPPDIVTWGDPSAYYLRGTREGYTNPDWQNWLIRPLNIGAGQELAITMRAKSGSQEPNEVDVYLANGMDYYNVWVYGEGNRQATWQAIVGGGQDIRPHDIGNMAYEWHTYKWARDAAGWWSLYIDDMTTPAWEDFVCDSQLTSFDSIAVYLHRNGSCLDWVQVTPEPGSLALFALGGLTMLRRR